MLKKIKINGFAGLDVDLPLDPHMTVICGENGSGKTAVLDALYFTLTRGTDPDLFQRPGDFKIEVEDDYGFCFLVGKSEADLEKESRGTRRPVQYNPLVGYAATRSGFLEHNVYVELAHFKQWVEVESRLLFVRQPTDVYRAEDPVAVRVFSLVRQAISSVLTAYTDFKVHRPTPCLELEVGRKGTAIPFDRLSLGEKTILFLIGDIARRIALGNLGLENPLHGSGIVLIDEIELHLHPTIQRGLLGRLTQTFPNCQFIVTTNSPMLLGDRRCMTYMLHDGKANRLSVYGESMDYISAHLGVCPTAEEVRDKIDECIALAQACKTDKARSLYEELVSMVGPGHLELSKLSVLLRRHNVINKGE